MAVILMNFADAGYRTSQMYQVNQFRKFHPEAKVIEYNESIIDNPIPESLKGFGCQNIRQLQRGVINEKRGFGNWGWKAPIMYETIVNRAEEGDIVVYMDCGVAISERIDPLLEFAYHNTFCMFNVYNLPNIQWCKRDSFVMMECDEPEFHHHVQYNGHCQIFKVNNLSRKYIKDYLLFSLCPSLLNDEPSKLKPEYPKFIEHRHDQSIQSLLAQQAGIPIVQNPCEIGRFLQHHRKKNREAKIVWGMHPGGKFYDAEKEEGNKIYWTDEEITQIKETYAR